MNPIHYSSSIPLINNICQKPLKVIHYADYPSSKNIFFEKTTCDHITYNYNTQFGKNTFDFNIHTIDNQAVYLLKNIFIIDTLVLNADSCFFPCSIRRRVEKNGNILFLGAGNIFCYNDIAIPGRKNRKLFQTSQIKECIEPVFYLPVHDSHFGHFLFESIGYLYSLIKSGCKKIITNCEKKQWLLDFLAPFGFYESDILFMGTDMWFLPSVFVANSLSVTGLYFNEKILTLYDQISDYYLNKQMESVYIEKIYLSRSNVKNRKLINENEVEAIFQSFGFKSIHLETLSIADQINIISNCKYMAGPLGTAFHMSFFSNTTKQKAFLTSPKLGLKNYLINFAMRNIESTFFVEQTVNKKSNLLYAPWTLNTATLEQQLEKFVNF